jgi:hypothetical protein
MREREPPDPGAERTGQGIDAVRRIDLAPQRVDEREVAERLPDPVDRDEDRQGVRER